MKRILILGSFLLTAMMITSLLSAQETFPYNGVKDQREGLYAFTNATIYSTYDQKLEGATLLIHKGKVMAVGEEVDIPAGAVLIDASGKTIYPSFIDLYADYGLPEVERERTSGGRSSQPLSKKEGAYSWNQAIKPEVEAHQLFTAKEKEAESWRKAGFGAVMSHQMDGISRGTSSLVTLGKDREHEAILLERAAHHLSLNKGVSTQSYPSSLMGAIALLRQTYYDAQWYAAEGRKEEVNLSLEAWNERLRLPQVFELRDKLEVLRAQKIADEFDQEYIFVGNGDEYQLLDQMKETRAAFILPLDFPDAYDVEDPYDANMVSLAELKHWELAPSNPARLEAAGIEFALTTHTLKSKSTFWKNLRKAIQYGLSPQIALKALTHTPARLIGAEDQVGSLEAGKWANFIITSGDLFGEKVTIYHNWVQGKPYVLKDWNLPDLEGKYELNVQDQAYAFKMQGEADDAQMTILPNDSTEVKASFSYERGLVNFNFTPPGEEGALRFAGAITDKSWKGNVQLADGSWTSWSASFQEAAEEKEEQKDAKETDAKPELGPVIYPFTAYGSEVLPKQERYIIRNTTVWTNEAEGILKNTDVLIDAGKIAAIGKGLRISGAVEINGEGMHLTPGIIDEHSHIAISRGVNEGTQSSSAEVRIGDVVDSEDINIYRQLSGGVTTSQLLHGSANPIGGQSAIIKLRWGYTPEEMKFDAAPGFIKFALGENVKQSNWGADFRTRFPQTRMGVEQVYENYFTEAQQYREAKASGDYRTDLELEALLEILDSERFITCHSYRQSEINMLMKVAERFGFRINTFTHILEGYKIADIMAEHGAGGSSFSDWWAYKFEVYEAIPHNGALMHEQGVTVAFNSDDAEMARRLNQEAAKAVKYGGMAEEEALKFVTLNPAKLLHIDDHVGSVKVGKDADLVLWTDHPLSVYTQAQMTFIDGIKFFDREEDLEKREAIRLERARLIQKMLGEKKNGGRTRQVEGRFRPGYHCDTGRDEAGE